MVRRSTPSSPSSVNASSGQTLTLIASDGVRVSVSRAIATEASYVLRDLLDGQDLVASPSFHSDGVGGGFLSGIGEPSPHLSVTSTATTAQDLENLFVDSGTSPIASANASANNQKSAVPDLMDFFVVTPSKNISNNKNASTTAAIAVSALTSQQTAATASNTNSVVDAPLDDILASLWGPQSTQAKDGEDAAMAPTVTTTHVPSMAQLGSSSPTTAPPPPAEVELTFPYFTGDILERVCRHMSYRYRMSSFGTENGCYRVYMVKTRTIPRPMTLPLVEYLDAKDRCFICDWDELITVQMVKAATLLNYEELLQLASAKLATFLIERDLEGVRTLLGVDGDFDAAEEVDMKKEQATEFNR